MCLTVVFDPCLGIREDTEFSWGLLLGKVLSRALLPSMTGEGTLVPSPPVRLFSKPADPWAGLPSSLVSFTPSPPGTSLSHGAGPAPSYFASEVYVGRGLRALIQPVE